MRQTPVRHHLATRSNPLPPARAVTVAAPLPLASLALSLGLSALVLSLSGAWWIAQALGAF